MALIIGIIYIAAGYWAAGETIYANKIFIGDGFNIFIWRVCVAMVLGWALIPVAIIKRIFSR